jgi:putative acetyltransferase
MTRIAFERPDQPEVAALIDELDAYQQPLYPPESHHGIDIDALTQPHVLFAVARSHEGMAVGCGALLVNDGWGELKRMFVRPSSRGHGIARRILASLEASAQERGLRLMRLETGVSQPEALRLYERAGYVRRGPFANYGSDPLSVFMEKRLQA